MKKTLLFGLCIMLAVVVAGCSTIKGLGEDVSVVGGWLTRGSEKAQE